MLGITVHYIIHNHSSNQVDVSWQADEFAFGLIIIAFDTLLTRVLILPSLTKIQMSVYAVEICIFSEEKIMVIIYFYYHSILFLDFKQSDVNINA